MSELFEKLKCINKEKDNVKRLKRLKKLCSDGNILNDALEIAKHESSINLSGAILITALSAILITVLSTISINLIQNDILRGAVLLIFLIIYFAVLLYIVIFEFRGYTNLYYDLIDLRRESGKESDISKLDIIIDKVEAIKE